MVALIGVFVVLAAIIGGYKMEHGNLAVLFQPAEFVIIFGAALGSLIISSPLHVLKAVVSSVAKVFTSHGMSKEGYLDILGLLNEIFTKMRKEGLIAIEDDIENPAESPIFTKYPGSLKNKKALSFICDNIKVIISTNVTPYELENIMDMESEAYSNEAIAPANSVAKVADALPGLGIVAAVLGVVLTMGKISEPPEVLGHSIGAAMVGTFLGVLMCYGFVGPIATNLEHSAHEDMISFLVIKVSLVSFVGGAAPQIAVEFGRRVIPTKEKPTFEELEAAIRK
ncbi:MAG: flagellar motor stator protein MotA [Nitrospirota bacterium]|nr:flagellar motor stator protein MotA [Nitrospirota bacterium]